MFDQRRRQRWPCFATLLTTKLPEGNQTLPDWIWRYRQWVSRLLSAGCHTFGAEKRHHIYYSKDVKFLEVAYIWPSLTPPPPHQIVTPKKIYVRIWGDDYYHLFSGETPHPRLIKFVLFSRIWICRETPRTPLVLDLLEKNGVWQDFGTDGSRFFVSKLILPTYSYLT